MNLPPLSPEAENILAGAALEAMQLGHRFIGVEHLFLGIAAEMSAELATSFSNNDADLDMFLDALKKRIGNSDPTSADELVQTPRLRRVLKLSGTITLASKSTTMQPSHLLEAIFREGRSVPVRLLRSLDLNVAGIQETITVQTRKEVAPMTLLERFGRDLTALARDGQLSPVIAREEEMDFLSQVLLRKQKNNPVLVGEAGVGKTAVVEGFAQRLVSEGCPEPFQGRRIIELSLGSLVAGTKFRGQFEERLLGIVQEVTDHPEVIIFLDELHTLVGAGATGEGETMDASNIIKPALARGEIRCIGATTIDEYRRHIEKDPALERRFEKVLVDEPSPEDALKILERVRETLETHHKVEILPEALEAAVALTMQHILDRRLPDKALDAVDQACAGKRLQRYARLAEGKPDVPVKVGAQDVATTVSQWTGIPLERVSGEAAKSLLSLEQQLLERVHGQEEAVRAVSRIVLTAKAGLADSNRPMGVFFFTGPTGVGKTHLAKSLTEVLFDDPKRLVRVDMSEFTEAHSISKLTGAPPGYVGHENEGSLISALRTHPHCIVLFDEVEKAHPQVFDIFLQIFDEGKLTGSHGKVADFTQSVVILTSNIDTTPVKKGALGFSLGDEEEEKPKDQPDPRDALRKTLRPELINRLDEVVVFNPLGREALCAIVNHYVTDIADRLEGRKVQLELDQEVYDHLLDLGDVPQYGARELRRVVDREVRQPLAQEILRHGDEIRVIRVQRGEDGLKFVASKSHGITAT